MTIRDLHTLRPQEALAALAMCDERSAGGYMFARLPEDAAEDWAYMLGQAECDVANYIAGEIKERVEKWSSCSTEELVDSDSLVIAAAIDYTAMIAELETLFPEVQ